MSKRYCVVTPYYKEDREIIERCLMSVRNQTVPVDHIVVADGHPQDWLDSEPVRHIKLDRSHADYGNTARGIGALLAVAEKYDAITFLDADNWYDLDHIEVCLAAASAAAASETKPDIVLAQRRYVRPDGSWMNLTPPDKPIGETTDTNCYFFLPPSYYTIGRWCIMPQEMSQHGDQLFYYYCKTEKMNFAITEARTVNYTCMFASCYRDLNEEPPPGAKGPVDWYKTQDWLKSLSTDELLLMRRRTGLYLRDG